MPVSTHDPVALMARAAMLRQLATSLSECPVAGLVERAGPDTWLGPTADRCRDELRAHSLAIAAAVEDLRARARGLENQAAALRPLQGPC